MTNIKIKYILEGGIANKERLVLKVTGPDNIGLYFVFITTETKPGYISSFPKQTYWFPDREVKSGDTVVLYSGNGTNSQKVNADGSTTYFYYWGLAKTVWNSGNDTAALLKIEQWEYKTRGL